MTQAVSFKKEPCIKKAKQTIVIGVIIFTFIWLYLLTQHDIIACSFRCEGNNWECINNCQWWDADCHTGYEGVNCAPENDMDRCCDR